MNKYGLTTEQLDWVFGQIAHLNFIFVGLQGSHLFGLNREGSDYDIKAVYLPTQEELILGKGERTFTKKSEELNIEIEVKCIQSFLNSLQKCDTVSIDMLHTPMDFVLHTSRCWQHMQKCRLDLYAKNMKGIIGYIKTHANKYTNKIDRLHEMTELLEITRHFAEQQQISTLVGYLIANNIEFKYIEPVSVFTDHEQDYLEVCGKKYITSWSILELNNALKREIARYGKRSVDGMGTGIDSKSLSHALRVLVQLKEMIVHKTVTFPLKDAEYILAVKTGKITNTTEVLNKIDELYDETMSLLEQSSLPNEPRIDRMVTAVMEEYWNV